MFWAYLFKKISKFLKILAVGLIYIWFILPVVIVVRCRIDNQGSNPEWGCILHNINTLVKDMNPTILFSAIGI